MLLLDPFQFASFELWEGTSAVFKVNTTGKNLLRLKKQFINSVQTRLLHLQQSINPTNRETSDEEFHA